MEIVKTAGYDFTFTDLVISLKAWSAYLIKKWKIILFISVIGTSFGFLFASFQKPNYNAKLTFVVEEGKGASPNLGSLASLAGQFGVDIGGSNGGGLLSGDNILLYFKSSSLAREVLLSPIDSSNSTRSIADEYVKVYNLEKGWLKDNNIKSIKFPVLKLNQTLTRQQDSLLKVIIDKINTNQFNVARVDKKASIIEVSTTMRSEMLAKIYCEKIVQSVVERYITLKTKRQYSTVLKLQFRADSLESLLRQKTISGAKLQSSSSTLDINPLYKTRTSVASETTQRDKTLLSTIYASVVQNLELAKFTLNQDTPIIQIVDSPILPLKIEKLSRLKAALIGLLATSSLTIFVLVYKKIKIKRGNG